MKKIIPLIVVGAVVFAGSGFYAGYKFGGSQTPGRLGRSGQFAAGLGATGKNAPRIGGLGAGGGAANGEILSKDDKSLTIKLRDGGSKIVFYSGNTTVMKYAPGTTADLVIGASVMVLGNTNSDGSVTAENVQLRPSTTTLPVLK